MSPSLWRRNGKSASRACSRLSRRRALLAETCHAPLHSICQSFWTCSGAGEVGVHGNGKLQDSGFRAYGVQHHEHGQAGCTCKHMGGPTATESLGSLDVAIMCMLAVQVPRKGGFDPQCWMHRPHSAGCTGRHLPRALQDPHRGWQHASAVCWSACSLCKPCWRNAPQCISLNCRQDVSMVWWCACWVWAALMRNE